MISYTWQLCCCTSKHTEAQSSLTRLPRYGWVSRFLMTGLNTPRMNWDSTTVCERWSSMRRRQSCDLFFLMKQLGDNDVWCQQWLQLVTKNNTRSVTACSARWQQRHLQANQRLYRRRLRHQRPCGVCQYHPTTACHSTQNTLSVQLSYKPLKVSNSEGPLQCTVTGAGSISKFVSTIQPCLGFCEKLTFYRLLFQATDWIADLN